MLINNLKKLRVSGTFMSATDVAKEVSTLSGKKITYQQMSFYESNKMQPNLILHKAFAQALSCTVEDLYTYIEDGTPLNQHEKQIKEFYNL